VTDTPSTTRERWENPKQLRCPKSAHARSSTWASLQSGSPSREIAQQSQPIAPSNRASLSCFQHCTQCFIRSQRHGSRQHTHTADPFKEGFFNNRRHWADVERGLVNLYRARSSRSLAREREMNH